MKPLIGIMCRLSESQEPGAFSIPEAYVSAVEEQGGAAVLVPTVCDPASLPRVLEVCDGLLITGGADVDPALYGQEPQPKLGAVGPANDAADRVAVEFALERPELPLLAICRGIQSVNVFAGARCTRTSAPRSRGRCSTASRLRAGTAATLSTSNRRAAWRRWWGHQAAG